MTAAIKGATIPEAIRQFIGFYPITMALVSDSIINVECPQKTTLRYKGRIVDEKGEAAEYANIVLLSPADSSFIAGGVSNKSGYFVIPCNARRVIARVSYVGYKTRQWTTASPDHGTIRLQADQFTLHQIDVTRIRPTISYKGDRTVVDIRHSILGTGNNAESLLDQLPGDNYLTLT